MRLRRRLVAAGMAMGATLALGAAAAEASTLPALVGAVSDTNTATAYTSGTVSVATQNTAGGWFAYTPSYYSDELTAISLANPAAPSIVGTAAPSGTQLDGADTVNIFVGTAYVVSKNENGPCSGAVGSGTCDVNDNGSGNALTLFDVASNPATPAYRGSIQDTSDGGGTGGVADGGKALFGAYGVTVTKINGTPYALVAAQGCLSGQPCPDSTVGNDLAVIDVSSPSSPTLVGSVSNSISGNLDNDLLHPTAVAVSGNYAYVTSFYGDALTVVDISNPTNPTVVKELQSTTDFPAPADVAIQGNYAYVANQNGSASSPGTMTVVNISNPSSPTVVGRASALGLSGGYRIRVSGNFAYVSARNVAAITPMDISNPAAPYVITSLISSAGLNSTTGLDLMNQGGSEYVVASSPYLSSQSNHTYPTFPAPGRASPLTTGTISAIQLDPVTDTATINPSSEPSTSGQPYTTSTSASFSFSTADAVSTVACSLDGSAYAPCTSLTSAQYSGLALGQHTFSVQATDAAGNNQTASYSWTIQAAAPPPANTALPAISGSPVVGTTLTASTGSWTGAPTSYTYRWQQCDALGANCGNLTTTTATYQVVSGDLGSTLRVVVTATNGVGSVSATSVATAVVTQSAGAPIPGFTDSPTGVSAVGSPVTFTSTSRAYGAQKITSTVWNFGDGTSGAGATITHPYTAAGTYTITLTVTQTDGQTAKAVATVTVDAPPSLTFGWSPTTPTAGTAVTFASLVTSGTGAVTGYSWNFGDGSNSTAPDPTHTYSVAGTYTATLTVTQSDGLTAIVQHSITVSSAASTVSVGPTSSTGPANGGTKTATVWLAHALVSIGSPRIGTLLKKHGESVLVTGPSARGRIAITWYATVRHHRFVVARGSATLHTVGRDRIAIHLTAAGRRLLTKSKAVRITISASFRSTVGTATAVRTMTVRR